MDPKMKILGKIRTLLYFYIATILICSGAYALIEGVSYLDALWWSCVTAVTVGYGDMYPVTFGGKVIGVLLMHTTVLFLLPLLIGTICSKCIENVNEFTHEEQEEIKQQLTRIEKLLEGKIK